GNYLKNEMAGRFVIILAEIWNHSQIHAHIIVRTYVTDLPGYLCGYDKYALRSGGDKGRPGPDRPCQQEVWALNKLIVKERPWTLRFIAKLGAQKGLQKADIEDAQQEGMLSLRAGILAFDCLRAKNKDTSSLRSFLRYFLKSRF